ncbi:MAG: glycoside hydrolase family 3 C-terminal domain-containing protein [Bacteroidales bacterium]|nr:glycoside hydrolase family 3 C-terminal domain-containing protein [Bacteroidales bacterium]
MINKSYKAIIIWVVCTATCLNLSVGIYANNGCNVPDSLKGTFWDPNLNIDIRVNDLVSRLTLEEKVKQLVYNAPAIERLGIPEYNWWNECLHGVARNGRATVFPQAIGMAATFDDSLIYRIASAIADEARAKFNAAIAIGNRGQYSGLTFWTPNINIFRDPRWGRGQETYGEDPYLTSRIGVAFVKGLQGNNPRYLKAAACAKHYVVHSGPEALRHEFNAVPTKKDFIETYTPAFEALAKEAKVEGFMCAYNRTFNEPCCGSKYLLTDLLRNQWGFDGYITSDCWAIVDFYQGHKVVETPEEAAAMALKAGVELDCGNVFYPHLITAIEKGLLTESEVDARLKHLLRTRFKLGLFDPPACNPYNQVSEDVINSPQHKALALEAAEKSIVLLKNANHVLPLPKDIKYLYVLGPNANTSEVLIGNYYGQSGDMSPILAGITAKVNAGTKIQYKYAFLPDRKNINSMDWVLGDLPEVDAAICVMGISGLFEGEEGESIASPTKGDRLDYSIPHVQIEYLKKVRNALKNKPLILVLTAGSPIDMTEIEPLADAILYAWYPGEQGGYAVGNIIFGDAVPSGRLPITFPKSFDQLPPYEDYSMEGRTYKYMKSEPMYPFGFGLSYSTFKYSDITTNSKKYKSRDNIKISVKVKNMGQFPAEEVVQLYFSVPSAKFRTPQFDLKQFRRVKLQPQEECKVEFDIPIEKLYSIDDQGNKILLKGQYKLFVGGACPLARSIELGASQWVESSVIIQ